MRKGEFKKIVKDGLERGKCYMAVKIVEADKALPITVLIQGESIPDKVSKYLRSTDDNLTFKDTGNQIEDVLLTSNLNDLSWFIY